MQYGPGWFCDSYCSCCDAHLRQVETTQRVGTCIVKVILILHVERDLSSLFERGLINLVLAPLQATIPLNLVNHLTGVWDNYRLR